MSAKYEEEAQVYAGQPVRIEDILEALARYHPEADATLVQRAYIYAASAHQGMTRRSGEPYLNHPLAVAGILCDMKLDAASVAAGLLHDTLEDTEATLDDIDQKFGREVAAIVDGVTKISRINFSSATERKASNMRKMILAMLTDLRVILVKLADRLNNMRTLGFMPEDKQLLIANETLEIFAPLSSRLGIHKIQTELEDLCLYYLEPPAYNEIRLNLSAGRRDRLTYVDEVIELLSRRIGEFKIKALVEGRPKHIFSIWKKMRDQKLTFDQIYDLTAFRIIVDTVQDCYSALGVIHSIFKAIPGRFKDYINLPKPNGYQSLHTAVIGPRNSRIEIQIRTRDMHDYAENGVAAHWRYKNGGGAGGLISLEETKRITALRSILSWQENLVNPDAFLNYVRESLADRESIYVFTPMGDPKELPAGSCPVDFAYSIHTMVGHNCVGAKVNGGIAPLRHKLNNGDTVEIITSRQGVPSRDWLTFVVSAKAKARIRHWFAQEEKTQAVHFGHDLLEKEMRRAGLAKSRLDNPEVLKRLGFKNLDEINAAVAFGRFPVNKILQALAPEKFKAEPPPPAQPRESLPGEPDRSGSILVSGIGDVFVRLAKCCSPLLGEPIIGYITQGQGVSIHTAACSSLAGLDPDRLVSVSWSDRQKDLFEIRLRVRSASRPGIFAEVMAVVNKKVENILEAHLNHDGVESSMWFRLAVRSQAQFAELMRALKQMPLVRHAERVL